MNRRARRVIIGSVICMSVLLLPMQAPATVCMALTTDQYPHWTLVIETAASLGLAGDFNPLAGLAIASGYSAAILSGNSRLLSDGTTRIGFTLYAHQPGSQFLTGTLNGAIDPPVNPGDPPQFTSGFGDVLTFPNGSANFTAVPVDCPPLP